MEELVEMDSAWASGPKSCCYHGSGALRKVYGCGDDPWTRVQYGLLDRRDEEETAGWMGKTIDMFTVAGMINQCAR